MTTHDDDDDNMSSLLGPDAPTFFDLAVEREIAKWSKNKPLQDRLLFCQMSMVYNKHRRDRMAIVNSALELYDSRNILPFSRLTNTELSESEKNIALLENKVTLAKNKAKIEKLCTEENIVAEYYDKTITDSICSHKLEEAKQFITDKVKTYVEASTIILEKYKIFRNTKDGIQLRQNYKNLKDFKSDPQIQELEEPELLKSPQPPKGLSYAKILNFKKDVSKPEDYFMKKSTKRKSQPKTNKTNQKPKNQKPVSAPVPVKNRAASPTKRPNKFVPNHKPPQAKKRK